MSDVNKRHYEGKLVDWYDRLASGRSADTAYYEAILQERGGCTLELACGTGRMLIPFREKGMDVNGMDLSGDMLALCRRKLEERGLSADLFEQNLAHMDIGREYRTVFISGSSFQHIPGLDDAQSALNGIYRHLEPDGLFVADLTTPWQQIRFGQEGVLQVAGTATHENERLVCRECGQFDILGQMKTGHYTYEFYRDGVLTQTIYADLALRWYGVHEFVLMLEHAGFTRIDVETDNIPGRTGETVVYSAYKEP